MRREGTEGLTLTDAPDTPIRERRGSRRRRWNQMGSRDSEGARLKLARARAHTAELQREWDAFKTAGGMQVVRVTEPNGHLAFTFKATKPIPATWSTVLGDALHNLRSALDLLACRAVERNKRIVTDQTRFPFGRDRATVLNQMKREALKGASDVSQRLVSRLKPYGAGGNTTLWRLHRLNIADKHRLLITVGAAYRNFGISVSFQAPGLPEPLRSPIIGIRPADRMFPLLDGAVLFRMPPPERPPPGEPGLWINDDMPFTIELAFGESQVVDGEPVFPSLDAMTKHVERIIGLFDRFVF